MTHRDLPVLVAEPVDHPGPALIPFNFVHPGLSLTQIISILRAYRGAIVLTILAVMAATTVLMALLPRTYTASVALMVNYEVNDPINGKQLPIGLLSGYISTQIELIQNPEVLLPVVDRLKLTTHKDYTEGYREGKGSLREWAAKHVSKNLVVYQGQYGSQLIYVNYSAHDSMEAARVANSIVDTYLALTQLRSLKAQLASQVRSLEAQLAAEEAQMAKLKISLADQHPQVIELQAQIDSTRKTLAAAMSGDMSVAPTPANPLYRQTPEMASKPAAGMETNPELLPSTQPSASGTISPRATEETTYVPPRSVHANTSVVNRATPPVKAVKPKLLTGFALGAIAAFILGLGIPLAYELFNRRVRCRDDLERHHGVPVLVEFNSLPMMRGTL